MQLIYEYENMVMDDQKKSEKEFRYSDLIPELEFIEQQLWNGQQNLESLKEFA